MVDFGETGPRALKETAGLDTTDLKNFFCSHRHKDHAGGLARAATFLKRNKSQLIVVSDELRQQLCEYTLHDLRRDFCTPRTSLSDFFDIVYPRLRTNQRPGVRDIFEIQFGDIHLAIFRTKHVDNVISYGLFIDDRVFFSGDTRFDLGLICRYAGPSEVMFHDCQLVGPGIVHATLPDLRTLPEEVRKKMYLAHYEDDWRECEDLVNEEFAGFARPGDRYIFN
mgnify:CR=1 FL=1